MASQPGNFSDLVLSERERSFSMESDQELIELANKGDTDAFETLYRRYRDWVYRSELAAVLVVLPDEQLIRNSAK